MAITLDSQYSTPASINAHNGLRIQVTSSVVTPEIRLKVEISYTFNVTTTLHGTVWIRPVLLNASTFEINIADYVRDLMTPVWVEGTTGLTMQQNELQVDLVFTEVYYDVNDIYTEYATLAVNCGKIYNVKRTASDYIMDSMVTVKDFVSDNAQGIITDNSPAVFNFISEYTSSSLKVVSYSSLPGEPEVIIATNEYPAAGGSTLYKYHHFELNHLPPAVMYDVSVLNILGGTVVSEVVRLLYQADCNAVTLYWVNDMGGWSTFIFPKVSKQKDIPEKENRFAVNTALIDSGERHQSVNTRTEYVMSVAERTETNIDLVYTIFSSPRVLMNYEGDTFPVIINDKPKDKKNFTKLPDMTVTVITANKERAVNAY